MRKRGVGFSSSFQGVNYHFGHPDISHVDLAVDDNNCFVIHAAASDLGQGLEATLIKIVTQVFGDLPVERVRWAGANTGEPDAGSTGASRQTTLTGNALLQAAHALKLRLAATAAEMLDVPPEDVTFAGEAIYAGRADSQREATLDQLLTQAKEEQGPLRVHGQFKAPATTALDDEGRGNPINQFGYATHVVEVEVDTVTGEVTVLRVDAYHESGSIVHQLGAEGQVEGGIVMGLGFALTEEFLQHSGEPVNVGLTNYLIPSVHDAPEIVVHFIDRPVPLGDLGVKGLAEIPTATIAPAIANAIYDATGARVTRLPATPERVLAAIQEAEGDDE